MARRRYQHPTVRATKAKRPRWYFRAYVDVRTESGIDRQYKPYYLGYCDKVGKRKAEKMRDAVLSEAINRPALIIQSQVKFAEVLKAFQQDHMPTVKDVTRRSYEFFIRRYIAPTFGDSRLCDIGAREVQQWINGMRPTTATRRTALCIFAAIWNRAIAWNYTQTVCPTKFVAIGGKRTAYQRGLPTKEQFRRILALLPEVHRDICELIVTTGMRISEVRGLPIRAVDFERRCLTVEQRMDMFEGLDVPKSQKARRVLPLGHMASRLRKYVRAGATPDDLLFRPLPSYQMCHYHLDRAARKVGFASPGFGHHSLRAANATWLRKGGLSIEDAKEQLGHTSDQVANLYLRSEAEDYARRERAVLALQAELMGKAEGGVQ